MSLNMEVNPRTTGFIAELATNPQTQHKEYGQNPVRDIVHALLGQILTNINYFLTVADLCAIFYHSLKTWNSCKKWSVNLSKTRVDQQLY